MPGSEMFYGNYQFSPVPLFSWTTETIYDANAVHTFIRHTLDFTGTLLDGRPSQNGSLDFLILRMKALQNGLASGQQEWRVNFDGNPVISGIYPRVTSVAFAEGIWIDRMDYTFTFQYDEDFHNTGIQSYTETWNFEEQDDRRTVSAKHDISAVGLNTTPSGVNNSVSNAMTFVLARTGYGNVVAGAPAFVQVSGSYSAYEELRTEQIDVQAGTFGVSENFTLSSGSYIHKRTSQFAQDDQGIITVSMDGEIRGLGRGDTGWPRALSGWQNQVRPRMPMDASGTYSQLNGTAILFTSNPKSLSITKSEFAGTINYSVAYTDSPTENLPSGILDFTFNVVDNEPVIVYASFPIFERSLGNVIQNVGTSSEGTYSITGSAVAKPDYIFNDLLDYVETRVNARRPSSVNYQTLRLTQKQITKDEDNKTVNFSIVWTYTKELSQAAVDGPQNLN